MRFLCYNCGSTRTFVTQSTSAPIRCPECDGELRPLTASSAPSAGIRPPPSVKIQFLTYDDGTQMILIVGNREVYAHQRFDPDHPDDRTWRRVEARDVYRPYTKDVKCVGRLF